jgi:hypothetical protein
VPLQIEDEKVPTCTTTLAEDGVSYDIAVYSIIRHWLHLHYKSFSEILGQSTLLQGQTYLLCKEFPHVQGLITNTFQKGTHIEPLFDDLSENLGSMGYMESELSEAELYAQEA